MERRAAGGSARDEWRAMLGDCTKACPTWRDPFATLGRMSEASGRAASAGAVASRPSVIQLVFREKGALYAAYVPILLDGGLFVPTTREYKLGDDIYLLLSLPDDPQ